MKKTIICLLSICMALCLFTGCGSTATNVNVQDVHDKILAAAPVDEAVAMTEDDLHYEMELNTEDVEEFVGTRSNVSGNGDVVLVIKAVSGKADAIKTTLESELAQTVKFLGNYPDFAIYQKKAECGRIVVKGDVIVYVIGGDNDVAESDGAEAAYAAIDTAIDEALK